VSETIHNNLGSFQFLVHIKLIRFLLEDIDGVISDLFEVKVDVVLCCGET
jgi:hypothetical protein